MSIKIATICFIVLAAQLIDVEGTIYVDMYLTLVVKLFNIDIIFNFFTISYHEKEYCILHRLG